MRVTEDAGLRARIEAQVAARRADASTSSNGHLPADEVPVEDGRAAAKPANGSRPLIPSRAWTSPPAPGRYAPSEGMSATPQPPDAAGTQWRGSGPARPWAGGTASVGEQPSAFVSGPGSESAGDPSVDGRLRPARPWNARSEPVEGRRPDGKPAAPVPSHPDIVLRGMTDGAELADSPQPAGARRLGRALRHRGPSRSRDADGVDREHAEAVRREPERVQASLTDDPDAAPAVYLPDADAVSAYAEAAAPMLDLPAKPAAEGRRRRRTRRGEQALQPGDPAGRQAADAAQDEAAGAEVAPSAEAPAAPPAGDAATEPADAEYPWLRKQEVDLDLHGAATWDPAMYPSEPDHAAERPGRRALRWLLARAPEPNITEPPAVEPEESTPPATEPEESTPAGHEREESTPAGHEPEPIAAAEFAPAEPEVEFAGDAPAEDAVDVPSVPRKTLRARLFGRRRRADKDDDEDYEQFELPEPDGAFEEPWLKVGPAIPRPTRDWASFTPHPGEPTADDAEPTPSADGSGELPGPVGPAPAAEPMAEPVAGPDPQTDPVLAAAPDPRPAAQPALPAAAAPRQRSGRRRPSPRHAAGKAASRRPRPAPVPSIGTDRPRPAPGVAASAAGSDPARGVWSEPAVSAGAAAFSGGSGALGRTTPDLSRFLKVIEADRHEAETDADAKRPDSRNRWRGPLIRSGVTLLVVILAATVLRMFVVQPYYIPSESMEPTLHGCTGCNDDHVLVDKFSYRIHDPKQGDIVVFHRPADVSPQAVPEDVLIKRIVALGGDRIQIKKGQVIVNNQILEEDYLNENHACYSSLNYPKRIVPDGDVFVMGDNRCNSIDSRTFGPVPTSSIIGRAFARIWPINKIGFLHN